MYASSPRTILWWTAITKIPSKSTTGLRVYRMEAMIVEYNPRYIGFLLILYSPSFMKLVLSWGVPRRKDLPSVNLPRYNNVNPKNHRNKEIQMRKTGTLTREI
jgi:hypothetical protein